MRQKRIWSVALMLALALALLPPARPAQAATYTVTNTNDSGAGSLRQAIIDANNHAGADTIAFNIAGCGGVCTIQPASALPDLTGGGTTINGYSQPGAAPGTLLIQLGGTNAGSSSNGFTVTSANNVIMGLVINRFGQSGVQIYGSDATGNTVSGNHIGTDASGTADLGNTWVGVYIGGGAQNNTVGGDAAGERNVISGNNSNGVRIYGSSTTGNTVSGNHIGTDASGTADLGNTSVGVYIGGDADHNTVGGDAAGERNVISGNDSNGVRIHGSSTTGNTISGNYIGTDITGTADLGNTQNGVYIGDDADFNTVGGDTAGERNVISGNNGHGVEIYMAWYNIVSGNYIGTNAAGTDDLGNTQNGVYIGDDADFNTVGGDAAGERNVISGNNGHGVEISGSSTTNNTVSGNYIGTNAAGTADLGNTQDGVYIGDDADHNTVGGDAAGERNVISGNGWYGVEISGFNTGGNTISGNYIGTNAAGTAALGNTQDGVYIGSAPNNTVGGDTAGERNVISGNNEAGVGISGSGDATGNTVSGNYIGTNAAGTADLGNIHDGVYIYGSPDQNTIGGDTVGEGNVISGNGWYGVEIFGSSTTSNTVSGNYIGTNAAGTADLGNTLSGVFIYGGAQNNIVGPDNLIAYNDGHGARVYGSTTSHTIITHNSIFSNERGISLEDEANGGIAAPVIVTTTQGSVNVVGTACPSCTVEVFANSNTDGEGETYVGNGTATAGGNFTVTVSSLSKPYLTATATDAISNTSEFSAVFTSTVTGGTVYLPIILKNY